MFIHRELAQGIEKLAEWYPVVSVTGPRQSGKSTLVQTLFPDYDYINLEEPRNLARAQADPSAFIRLLPQKTIIDEAQYVPEVFSVVQARADKDKIKGQFILSGSQNFLLMKSISQSLAGRVGIARLLPLSYRELDSASVPTDVDTLLVRGFYPEIAVSDIPSDIFFNNYVDTYVTRDVTGYLDVRNESAYRSFLTAVAVRAGNLLNYADLARDVGVTVATIKSWLSILEASYIITLVRPYHLNIGKRLIKAPKIYFVDTGLLCHLLGIRSIRSLYESEYYGAIFENFVISEQIKAHHNALRAPEIFFYNDVNGVEIDMIDMTIPDSPIMCEIKSGSTYKTSFARHVVRMYDTFSKDGFDSYVIYAGDGIFTDRTAQVYGINEWLEKE